MIFSNSLSTMRTLIILFSSLLVSASCLEFSHHKHRHSRSHPPEYNFDRLLNRLDAQTSPKVPDTTSSPPKKDVFSDLDKPLTGSNSEPGNSLTDDDSASDSSTVSPLDMKRWDAILKGEKVNSDNRWEDEDDKEDDEEEHAEDEELEDEQDQEQADTYRPWNANGGESHTKWKWDNMGSRKSVDGLFQVYRSGLLKPDAGGKDPSAEVYRHSRQMAKETKCQWPKPKVVRVADVYGSTNKLYIPPCTVLHQCGDDTGCCSGTGQHCGPKTTNRVELYFYTTYIMGSMNQQRATKGLEKLPFYNHTECECVDSLEEVMPRDGGPSSDMRSEKQPGQGCKCPSEYTVRRLANGSCSCDCFDKQRDCIKYKRGKEYFNHIDRLCIEMGTCRQPACDFGAYLRKSGRCPRKHEKLRSWPRHSR